MNAKWASDNVGAIVEYDFFNGGTWSVGAGTILVDADGTTCVTVVDEGSTKERVSERVDWCSEACEILVAVHIE